MDIDKNNFKEIKEICLDQIKKADLIAMDLEMTGIRTEDKISRTDTPIERYRKCYKSAKKFTII